MRRLIRPLTIVTGILIVLAGGAVVGVNAGRDRTAGHSQVVAQSTNRSEPSTTTLTSPASAPTPRPTTAPTTASTIIAPAPVTTPTSPLAALGARLDAVLAGTTACLLVEDANGQPLYQHQPDTALIPASTQKLLVAAAALTTLGPNFRFVTNVVAPSAPVRGQVTQLWLVGNGDPLLATPEFLTSQAGRARVAGYPWTSLPTLADSVAAAGIASVPGGIHGDDSHLDRLRFLPVWPPLYQTEQEVGLLSALSVNEGIQTTTPKLTLAQDPPAFAASELARFLAARHVTVGTSGTDQAAPATGVVVATISSAPVSQIIEAMLRASDNWIAELLVRQIDRAAGGAGTTAGGAAAVLREAAKLGIPVAGATMDDGSGLSRTDRATCRELLAAVDLSRQPRFAVLLSGLPVAATSGTLVARYRNTPIAGNLRAKTGSLDGVGGMVGVLSARVPLRFAVLINQTAADPVLRAWEDQVVTALATYP